MTRLAIAVTAALLLAPAALADGVVPYALQGGPGVLSHDGRTRYVAVGAYGGATTTLAQIRVADGSVVNNFTLDGAWGVPMVTFSSTSGAGLAPDGKTLVLEDVVTSFPHAHSHFAFLDPRSLRLRSTVTLKGDFGFDALSPDGSRLYLIQHTDGTDYTRYVVRAFDVATHRLLPGRIADRTQKSWVMEGSPLTRVTSADARWVYTLYSNPRNVPFVHALDTVRGVAHCIGLPTRGDVTTWKLRLRGGSLAAGPWRIDTATWRVSQAGHRGFPWWGWLAIGLALAAATLIAAHGRRTRALAAGAAGRDRSPARLGSWLPLTRTRFRHVSTSSSRSSRSRNSGTTSSARRSSPPSTSAPSGSSSATTS